MTSRMRSDLPVESDGEIRQVTDREFYLLNTLQAPLDIFDWDNSIYEQPDPKWGIDIDHLILKEPLKGLPPIFRISVKPTRLFVSNAAKEALEASELKGMRFLDQDQFMA